MGVRSSNCAEGAPLAPNVAGYKELLDGAVAVLNALAETAGRSRDEQIDALRVATRYAEDHDCSDVSTTAFNIAIDKLGFTTEEADREIFLEALGQEPRSKIELECLAEEKDGKRCSAPTFQEG